MRHFNVVDVVSSVNELSLLSGLLAALFLAALFRGLLLSCHIFLLFSLHVVTTRYCVAVTLVV